MARCRSRADRWFHRWARAPVHAAAGTGEGPARYRVARVRPDARREGCDVAAVARGGGQDSKTRAWQPARRRAAPGSMSMSSDFHIVIVGGGLVGACTAALAANAPALTGARIAILDAHPPTAPPPEAEVDLRVSAVSRASE